MNDPAICRRFFLSLSHLFPFLFPSSPAMVRPPSSSRFRPAACTVFVRFPIRFPTLCVFDCVLVLCSHSGEFKRGFKSVFREKYVHDDDDACMRACMDCVVRRRKRDCQIYFLCCFFALPYLSSRACFFPSSFFSVNSGLVCVGIRLGVGLWPRSGACLFVCESMTRYINLFLKKTGNFKARGQKEEWVKRVLSQLPSFMFYHPFNAVWCGICLSIACSSMDLRFYLNVAALYVIKNSYVSLQSETFVWGNFGLFGGTRLFF